MTLQQVLDHLDEKGPTPRDLLVDRYGRDSVTRASQQPDVVNTGRNGELHLALGRDAGGL